MKHTIDEDKGGFYGKITPMPGQDKAGFWKCPYHNSSACIEIIQRIGSQL